MLHVWLRGAAVRTAADIFSPAAMSDPLEEAVRTGRHTAMLNLSKPCESLLKYEGGIMGHHHVGLCVCARTGYARRTANASVCTPFIFSHVWQTTKPHVQVLPLLCSLGGLQKISFGRFLSPGA